MATIQWEEQQSSEPAHATNVWFGISMLLLGVTSGCLIVFFIR